MSHKIATLTNRGFTLIELSVVLMIIALLAGGVLGGRHLIKAAKLQKVVQEVENYKRAMNTFKLKYGELPGDMTIASQYWPDCAADENVHNRCNGNGDGIISGIAGFSSNEPFRAWEHMSRAGIIDGEYRAGDMTIHGGYLGIVSSSINANAFPRSSFAENSAFTMGHVDTNFATAPYIFNRSFMVVTSTNATSSTLPTSNERVDFEALFTPEEAYIIDKKIDDGQPKKGAMFGVNWPNANLCLSGNNYNLQRDEVLCSLFFEILRD